MKRFAVCALMVLLAGCGASNQQTQPPSTSPATSSIASKPASASASAASASEPSASAKPSSASSTPAAPANVTAASSKPAASAPAGKALKTVHVITVGSPSDAGLLIGTERGYFAQQGLDVQFDHTTGGAEALPLIATGKADVAGVSLSAGFFNAVNQGVPVKVVADKGQAKDGWRGLQWVIRKDLWDSGKLHGLSDLKGATIGLNAPHTGAITDLALHDLLQAAHLTESDVKIVSLGYPEQVAALKNKAVDMVLMLEPGLGLAVKQGLGVQWEDSPEKGKVRQVGVLIYSPQFLASPEGKSFLAAYIHGVRDFNAGLVKNQDTGGIIRIMTGASQVKDAKVFEQRTSLFYVDPNGAIDWKSVQDGIDVGHAEGLIKQPVDEARFRDDSVIQAVISQFGKY